MSSIQIGNLLQDIEEQLRDIQNTVRRKQKNGDMSLTYVAELFIQELLNVCLTNENGENFELENLNYRKPNYPAVDLGDFNTRISWQVTATGEDQLNGKILKSLRSFYKHKQDEHFNSLWVFTLNDKPDKIIKREVITIDDEEKQIDSKFFDESHVWGMDDLLNYIEKNIKSNTKREEIIKVLKKIPERPIQTPYKEVKSYIPRIVSNKDGKFQLIELVEKEKLNVLLAYGGYGKSTELKQLAGVFSKKDNWLCYLLNLRDYSSRMDLEKYINYSCKNWTNHYSDQKVLILLDALDEIGLDYQGDIFNEVKLLLKKYSDRLHILISCRTNFIRKAIPNINKENTEEDRDFVAAYLNELTDTDIDKHIEERCDKPEDFKTEIAVNKIREIIRSPFFLTYSIQLFDRKGKLPNSKAQFFKEIINHRLETEEVDKGTVVANLIEETEKDEIINHLEKLAFIMLMNGQFQVSKSDLKTIIGDRTTINSLLRIINKKDAHYFFEHNNFQEYFAAKVLSRLSIERIISIIAHPEINKILPTWLNATTFLFSILEESNPLLKQLLEWIFDNDPEVVIRFEKDKLSEKQRFLFFKRIFENNKEKGTWINSNKFQLHDLAEFGQSNEAINYMVEEIGNNKHHRRNRLNGLHVMQYMKLTYYQNKMNLRDALIS
ncbi:MAG: SMEK domain-containing protein, partial [Bacteroidales bacterium]|nr:SMEK domain-containing protein [Bacteroidales bacterium]